MTASQQAAVEVLTAEVRVLMVGSRQVTMSVYNQLDKVRDDQTEPFGRVAPRDAENGTTYVVGASLRDDDKGSLVRSEFYTCAQIRRRAMKCRREAARMRELAGLAREREAARQAREQAQQDYEARRQEWQPGRGIGLLDRGELTRRENQEQEADRNFRNKIPQRVYAQDPNYAEWSAGELDERAAEQERDASWIEEELPVAEQWEKLPLIVLAGLR